MPSVNEQSECPKTNTHAVCVRSGLLGMVFAFFVNDYFKDLT